ncbi:hypothetical protein [Spiroplasma taiwanense]|uniref:Uncharacterized protein n=1 Tax=Spiroplasma taiwanense CT-1 TaxID=1276220 RepID=S5MHY2_9MOLU|nr:hypothetical protein [Spiroplasma taiwanense]AGR41500.1 hypothetical protein STAIW_v1c09140 [Spiroplasma taiwanense CT-1]
MFLCKKEILDELGVKLLQYLIFYKGIKISEEELHDFVFEEEFLDKNAIEFFEPKLINYGKFWYLIKSKILESKLLQKKGINKWAFDLETYKKIYLLLDEQGTYINNFSEDNEIGKEVINKIKYIESKIFALEGIESLIEYMLIIYIYFLNKQFFGEFTMEFLWIFANSILIFKECGPIFPAYNEELYIWIEKWEKLANQCKNLKISEYNIAPLYKSCFIDLLDASENSRLKWFIV